MTASVDHHKLLYQALGGAGEMPLEPGDPKYVEILEHSSDRDPIVALHRAIDWATSESVQLLTGFRGNGKSTQLRRLKHMLEQTEATVFLVDMNRHVLMTKPVEISDFLLSLMAGLSAAVKAEAGFAPLVRGYWERFVTFMKSTVEFKDLDLEVEAGGVSAKLGAQLQTDVTFKEKVQARMRGHVTRLVEEAQGFVVELVRQVRKQHEDPNRKVVLLVDSFEQLRGVGEEGRKVYDSARELFGGQSANLKFPMLHVVYSIPPYLVPLAPNLTRNFGAGALTVWPNIHVRDRAGKDDEQGIAVMEQLVAKRYPAWEKVLGKKVLAMAATRTGGDIRDFFRVVRDGVLTTATARSRDAKARFSEDVLRRALQRLRDDFGILADDDAKWLADIHERKEVVLASMDSWTTLARFFDSNILISYRNGEPWFDIHPLLVEDVRRRTRPAPRSSLERE